MVRELACWFALCALAACGFPKPELVSECMTASDCMSADRPFCVGGACVAGCASNADCAATAATPLCETSSGACVGCIDDSGCTADKPVCDATAGACRGCSVDDECASGVCLEADGTCAKEADVVYVSGSAGASDVGLCPRIAPCASLPYALSRVVSSRNVISVTAGQIFPTATIAIDRSVYIDANGTIVRRDGAIFSVAANNVVTLGNVTLTATGTGATNPAATVGAAATLRLYGANVTGQIITNGGGISASKSTFVGGAPSIDCTTGTVAVSSCEFQNSQVLASNCQLVVERSRFVMTGGGACLVTGGGFVRVENNLVLSADSGADMMTVRSAGAGSAVRFNTFVSTSGVSSDGGALHCDGTPTVTSNIFAYNSTLPLDADCHARYSVFDETAVAATTAGPGNRSAPSAKLFTDRARKDFHPGPESPARGAAEPGLGVALDIDGRARPIAADAGAYQR